MSGSAMPADIARGRVQQGETSKREKGEAGDERGEEKERNGEGRATDMP